MFCLIFAAQRVSFVTTIARFELLGNGSRAVRGPHRSNALASAYIVLVTKAEFQIEALSLIIVP